MLKILKPRKAVDPAFIGRPALAVRWGVHVDTIRRWQREGRLHPVVGISSHIVRYRMADILAMESK